MIATTFKSSASRLVALTIVQDSDDIMLVTANGVVTRINAGSISQQGRPATGVRAQNLNEGDSVVSVNKIINPVENEVSALASNSDSQAISDSDSAQQTSLLSEDSVSEE